MAEEQTIKASEESEVSGVPVGSAQPVVLSNTTALAVADHWDTTPQTVIWTTKSELKNILHDHITALEAKRAWIAPLTVVLSFAVALIAGVDSPTWTNLLYVGLGASSLWLAYTAKNAWQYRKHAGLDAIIEELRPSSAGGPLPGGPRK